MTCALKGYSKIKCGKGKKLKRQEMELERFFHGEEPDYPSQISLLANASYSYRELYDGSTVVSTNKNDSREDITANTLKDCYTAGSNIKFRSGIDITSLDLERRFLTGKQLITGRKLIEMARDGVKNYKKALSFCDIKYNSKTQTCIKSGDTVEDVIEYVRCKMYQLLKKNKGTEDDDRSECTNESQEEYDIEEPTESTEKQSAVEKVMVETMTEITPVDDIIIANEDEEDDYDDFDDVPQEYLFPSYYCFITYGPFAAPADQMSLLLTDDDNMAKGEGSRANKRKAYSMSKNSEASHDSSAVRGFSTSQRIDIEALNVQQQQMLDRRNETSIVALSIEESAFGRQIDAAERRAELRCGVYSSDNVHWQKVDALIEDQQRVMERIRTFNKETCTAASLKDTEVSDFLNKGSPKKYKAKCDADDSSISTYAGDDDNKQKSKVS